MITVFAQHHSSRLQFVLDFAFKDKGEEYQLCSSSEEFNQSKQFKLNYSELELDADYHISPSGVLEESTIDSELRLEAEEGVLMLRGASDELSIIFYLLSRYEEYVKTEKDEHGRFAATNADLKKLGLLKRPVCDELVMELWQRLGLDYSEVLKRFECVPSFDIDVAWAYKGRPLWRTLGGMVKNVGDGRLRVLLNREKDPYDTYSDIITYSALVDRIICFALLSDYGPKDKNIPWDNFEYQSLLRGLNSSGGMGIHPGYNSFLKAGKQKIETERLEEIVGHEVVKSRFHYLRFQLPESYEILIENGIKKDYSMGFADDIGFRAGTSFPFNFYNLNKESITDLLVFPFVYMDSSLKDQLKLTPQQASQEVKQLIQNVSKAGGLFMCIWHNHSINNQGEWKGWKSVLDDTVKTSLELYKS